jgi:hypothetical protein
MKDWKNADNVAPNKDAGTAIQVLFGPKYLIETGMVPHGSFLANPGHMFPTYPGNANHHGNRIRSTMSILTPLFGVLARNFSHSTPYCAMFIDFNQSNTKIPKFYLGILVSPENKE